MREEEGQKEKTSALAVDLNLWMTRSSSHIIMSRESDQLDFENIGFSAARLAVSC